MNQNQKENKLLWIGTVVNTHGIKGEVRVLSDVEEPLERFKIGNILMYEDFNSFKELKIRTMRFHKNFILLTFNDIENINDIKWLKTKKLYCEKDELNSDEYYLSDLIDKPVFDQTKEKIGIAKKILDQGPYENLIVELNNGKEINIPIVDEFEIEYDKQLEKITVKIPKEFKE
ncbi:MAG: ribosome maturation factor RimM [Candidatus Tyloplasma litorale]|nr:MAG: ribosome maturation factor RimM [Mycoplasmatales bacterium]